MNRWAQMLRESPASLQRLIARHNRISLPRGCAPEDRHARVRQALCHQATVRAMYALLPTAAQAALQDLRSRRGGVRPDQLQQQYGVVCSWTQLARDPRPQSIAEQLILLGWLLPRPIASPRHPLRYLVPPELRAWLPQPLRLTSHGPAPTPPPVPPALRAAQTILLAAQAQPLALRQDGTLCQTSLRRLIPRLAPLTTPAVTALCQFVLPLLVHLGLIASYHGQGQLAPAGQCFLNRPLADQVTLLRQAWIALPALDRWLTPLLVDQRGLDASVLRQRLVAWVDALPTGHTYDPATLYPALTATFGPLADAHTHGFRSVDRAPWQPKRAATIWEATLHGPLTWLGWVGWGSGIGEPGSGSRGTQRRCRGQPDQRQRCQRLGTLDHRGRRRRRHGERRPQRTDPDEERNHR